MREDLSGFNQNKIDILKQEILDSATKISNIFIDTCDLIGETSSYYQSDDADVLRAKFNNYKTNFSIVVNNIKNYDDELNNVEKNYSHLDENITENMKKDTTALASEFTVSKKTNNSDNTIQIEEV